MTPSVALDANAIIDASLPLTQDDCLGRIPPAQRDRILSEPSPLRVAEHFGVALWVVNPHYDGRGGKEKPVTRIMTCEDMLIRQCALYRLSGGNMDQLPTVLEGWLSNTAPTDRDGLLGDGPIEIRDGKSYIKT
ncbi:MAG: hypothetical protein AAGD25_26195 [Cyanobacteria bacterium P01_F01_bin.150]